MKIKKLIAALLTLAVLVLSFAVMALAAGPEEPVESNGLPYCITVNRQTNTAAVYGLDDNGYYTVPVRGMVCATGREGSETPLGTFALGSRYEWINMYGSTYVRYAVWFCDDNYFQSAGYSDTDKDALIAEEYNVIGTSATYGSVRLELADVKWIYDNCADGTTVVVYESDDPGPFGYCEKAVSAITAETDNGWEPTDPFIFNPWKYPEPTIVLAESAITISVYDCHTVEARVFPLGTSQNVVWSSSDEAVAQVDSKGVVYAASEGTAVITAKSGKLRADCAVTVAPRDANDPGIYPPKASNGLSYCIRVNTKTDTVTVLGLDEDGYYTVPVKNMICSTGKPGEETPLGTYWIYAKHRWVNMVDDSWGQYCSVFNGNIMFHSVCYYSKNTNDLIWNEYNDLGTNVSLGCVRLQVIDAKWIYDNCGDGTYVVVVDSDYPGPLGRGEKVIDYIPPEYNNGWEPTDPDPANPWLGRVPESIALDRTELKLDAHGTARLAVTATPAAAKELGIKFTSSDNSVATVDANGIVVAKSNGAAVITAQLVDKKAECIVTVDGEWLPFDDIEPGAWYIPYVRKAVERGFFSGSGDRTFTPNGTMTRAMLVQVLFNMSGVRVNTRAADMPFEDVPENQWYYEAVRWAYSAGIVEGMTETEFCPDAMITREQLCVMLHRYYVNYMHGRNNASTDFSMYSDADRVSGYAYDAVSFMLANGIVSGVSETELSMHTGATRAQACALFCRFAEKFLPAVA